MGNGPRDDGKGYGIDVDLEVRLPGVDKRKAADLMAKAHVVCPCSRATEGYVNVRASIA